MNTKKITGMGMMCTISIALVIALRLPIFAAAPYLEYDLADVPLFIGTLVYGPISGLIMTIIVSILQGVTVSAGGGIFGILMHITATGSFVLVSGLIFKKFKSTKGVIFALLAGFITWIIMMILFNILITPIFTGLPRKAVIQMLIPTIIPFNLIKAGINGTLCFILYKALEKPILSKLL